MRMRTSKKRTPAAILRVILGVKDAEMAELLNCARATIHSLESGRLRMSEEMAKRMFHETEISPEWLLAGDPEAPPVSARGEPYTKEIFDHAQAEKTRRNRPPGEWLMMDALDLSARLVAVLTSASNRNEYFMANYKAGRAIQALAKEFGQEPTVYAPTSLAHINADQALAVTDKMREGFEQIALQMEALPVGVVPEDSTPGFQITKTKISKDKRN